jgi:SpoVK/Ycf46/Vps4 family AAA+-type ATPase
LQGARRTGKTLAAHALAQELRADVWRIDLAALASKTIGETEKNLETLFDAAEKAGAVLLFDEADALFGTRADVKDAQDRYANLDAAALLRRIEDYDGIAILTTNLTHDLDAALPAEPRRRPCRVVRFPLVKRRR